MMLTVNAEEFGALSLGCRQELLGLLLGKDGVEAFLKEIAANQSPGLDVEEVPDGESSVHDVVGTTRAIDVTPEQVASLVARLADESVDTLKLFASGKARAISELIASNPNSYTNAGDLNRKFVGALNRALRSVTSVKGKAKDRSSVLLIPADDTRSSPEASDLLEKRIKVKPLTAVALRKHFQMPEPLPDLSYFRIEGDTAIPLSEQTETTQLLANLLGKSWKKFDGRPKIGRDQVSVPQVAEHFYEHGFNMFLGEEGGPFYTGVGATDEDGAVDFDFKHKIVPMQMPAQNEGQVPREYIRANRSLTLFVTHERAPGVAACFETLDWT